MRLIRLDRFRRTLPVTGITPIHPLSAAYREFQQQQDEALMRSLSECGAIHRLTFFGRTADYVDLEKLTTFAGLDLFGVV